MNEQEFAVIMAGGIGSRFWPMSRNAYPKQFHDVLGIGRTLLQMTFDRLTQHILPANIYVVTNAAYGELVAQQLPELKPDQILGEPLARNTAPCIAYAAFKIAQREVAARIVVTPADHYIRNEARFIENIKTGLKAARGNTDLITIGVNPTRPDTGYGYIQFNPEQKTREKEIDPNFFKVKTFTEKPNIEVARNFVRSGEFVWNSGIFIGSAAAFEKAYKDHLPEMYEQFSSLKPHFNTKKEDAKVLEVYEVCQQISIDHGIMEKADNVYVIRSQFGWSDLGTWGSLYEQMAKDEEGNAVTPNTRIYDSNRNIVKVVGAQKDKLVVLKGVNDLIIVDTGETLLVCNMEDEQAIKEIVTDLKNSKHSKYL